MTETWRDRLATESVEVLTPLAYNWFITTNASDAKQLAFVNDTDPLPTHWKIQRGLENQTGTVPVTVMSMPNLANGYADSIAALEDVGANVTSKHPGINVTRADVTASNLTTLAEHESVYRIEDGRLNATLSMPDVRGFTGTEQLHNVSDNIAPEGYTGHGVQGLHVDRGFSKDHTDLQSSLLDTWAEDQNMEKGRGHGTKAFGILHADGSNEEKREGMVPNASSVFAEHSVLTFYEQAARFDGSYSQGTFVTRPAGLDHRARQAGFNAYSLPSVIADMVGYHHNLLTFQSMDNYGEGNAYPSAMAKNTLSVGGLVHHDDQDLSNDTWAEGNKDHPASTGPSQDCRTKPDLVGPYDDVHTIGKYDDSEGILHGTSAAAPVVAGAGALTTEMYRKGVFSDEQGQSTNGAPTPAMVKSLLVNTAYTYDESRTSDATNGTSRCGVHERPQVRHTRDVQGWGLPQAGELHDHGRNVYTFNATVALTTGESMTVSLDIPEGTTTVNASLAWSDPPGTPLAGSVNATALVADLADVTVSNDTVPPALVNDLDLEVRPPNGTAYMGNRGMENSDRSETVDEEEPDEANFTSKADRRNNLENVFVPTVGNTSDVWEISVKAPVVNGNGSPGVPGVAQTFGLTVTVVVPPSNGGDGDGGDGNSENLERQENEMSI
jgi:hypothetical protein